MQNPPCGKNMQTLNDAHHTCQSFSSPKLCVLHSEPDCQVVWEKKPTPEEEEKAKSLQLPPTFFCGLSTTDSDTDHDKPEDFETEVRKAQQDLVTDTTLREDIRTNNNSNQISMSGNRI